MWHLVLKLVPLNDRISHINEWELSINNALSKCLKVIWIQYGACVKRGIEWTERASRDLSYLFFFFFGRSLHFVFYSRRKRKSNDRDTDGSQQRTTTKNKKETNGTILSDFLPPAQVHDEHEFCVRDIAIYTLDWRTNSVMESDRFAT